MTDTVSSPHGRHLADGVHAFGTLREGDWYETPSRAVTAAHIDTFAELTGDRFEIHMTDDAARKHLRAKGSLRSAIRAISYETNANLDFETPSVYLSACCFAIINKIIEPPAAAA